MIGLRLLHKIHRRLCEAEGSMEEPFGGFFIYFFGDLRQLPPVRDVAIYMSPGDDSSALGSRLVQNIQEKIQLSVCHRQAGEGQENFRRILDSIATGSVELHGWQLLMSRRATIVLENREEFVDAIHLFPTNDQVKMHNNDVLSKNRLPVALIQAWHNNSTARHGTDEQAKGLYSKLYLSIGCRIMLRKNLCVEKGLVDGTLGTVRDIVYEVGEGPPALPHTLLIEFDRYLGPFIRNRLFPLRPSKSNWKERGVDCTRRQFAINVAYALTIHKAQGLTLDKAIVEVGAKEAAAGLTYVALSRVRRLEDLILARPFDFPRLAMIANMRHVVHRDRFLRNFARDNQGQLSEP